MFVSFQNYMGGKWTNSRNKYNSLLLFYTLLRRITPGQKALSGSGRQLVPQGWSRKLGPLAGLCVA